MWAATTSDLVFVLLRVASLVVHLQDDFLQLLLSASHQLGGTLPLPESRAQHRSDQCSIMWAGVTQWWRKNIVLYNLLCEYEKHPAMKHYYICSCKTGSTGVNK